MLRTLRHLLRKARDRSRRRATRRRPLRRSRRLLRPVRRRSLFRRAVRRIMARRRRTAPRPSFRAHRLRAANERSDATTGFAAARLRFAPAVCLTTHTWGRGDPALGSRWTLVVHSGREYFCTTDEGRKAQGHPPLRPLQDSALLLQAARRLVVPALRLMGRGHLRRSRLRRVCGAPGPTLHVAAPGLGVNNF